MELGLGQRVVLWTDDQIFQPEAKRFLKKANVGSFQQSIDFILKTRSDTTAAYLKSEFFRLSLDISKTFRFITNATREADVGFRFHKSSRTDLDSIDHAVEAGPKLIRYFLAGPFQDLQPSVTKVEIMLLRSSEADLESTEARQALELLGIQDAKEQTVRISDTDGLEYFMLFAQRPRALQPKDYTKQSKRTKSMLTAYLKQLESERAKEKTGGASSSRRQVDLSAC